MLTSGQVPQVRQPAPACRGSEPGPKKKGEAHQSFCALDQQPTLSKVEVTPLTICSRCAMARQGLQLGFAAVNGQEIRRAVYQLAIALEELARPHL
jgi:hypothetical protein